MKPTTCLNCEYRKVFNGESYHCTKTLPKILGMLHKDTTSPPSWCPLGAEESKPTIIKESMKQIEEKMDKAVAQPGLGKLLQDWIDLPTITATEWMEKLKNGETNLEKKYKIGVEKYTHSDKGLYGITPIPLSSIPPYSLLTIAQANNKSGTMAELEENYNRIVELLKNKP